MRYIRSKKGGFDSKLIFNVMIASLLVQKAPLLIDMIIPLDPSVRTLAGVGAGFAVSKLMKMPEVGNASIALGAIDFVAPFVDQLLGTTSNQLPTTGGTKPMIPLPGSQEAVAVDALGE